MGIARSFQHLRLFEQMTVLENVRIGLQRKLGTSFHFWASARTLDKLNARAMELLEAVDLAPFACCVSRVASSRSAFRVPRSAFGLARSHGA